MSTCPHYVHMTTRDCCVSVWLSQSAVCLVSADSDWRRLLRAARSGQTSQFSAAQVHRSRYNLSAGGIVCCSADCTQTRTSIRSVCLSVCRCTSAVCIVCGQCRYTTTLTAYVKIMLYSLSQTPPLRFSEFFSKRLRIFNQFFTHLLYDPFYTRSQIFIHISPTLIKLCHTKHDHPANFHISLEL